MPNLTIEPPKEVTTLVVTSPQDDSYHEEIDFDRNAPDAFSFYAIIGAHHAKCIVELEHELQKAEYARASEQPGHSKRMQRATHLVSQIEAYRALERHVEDSYGEVYAQDMRGARNRARDRFKSLKTRVEEMEKETKDD